MQNRRKRLNMENKFIYRDESGCFSPVRFVRGIAIDAEGREVVNPRCEGCGEDKQYLIGQIGCAWICVRCSKPEISNGK